MKDSKNGIVYIIIAVLCLFLLVQCTNNRSENYEREESQAFSDQLHKDPTTWTKEERQRYSDFVEWQNKQ